MHQSDLDWTERFMGMADRAATWSSDPSTKVGAVLVDWEAKNVISVGFNRFAAGMNDGAVRKSDRAFKLARTVHAEMNAILSARSTLGLHLFSTHQPCAACSLHIAQAGVAEIYYRAQPDYDARWADDLNLARQILDECKLPILSYETNS